MKMPRPQAISPSSNHEEIFAQHYRWLMGWALRFTNHDREQAEDLVHDTFVQFMINRPDLGIVNQNIEGYLYSMLRNMHVSQVRRAARLRETAFPIADILSISETASVRTELRMASQRIQIQDELCRICQYASIRKNSSKVGGVVILRFFHGYYPNEIAAVTRSSRAGVDKMLQRARTEARLYLKDPGALSFLNGEPPSADLQTRFGQEPEDLLRELRNALYDSKQGDCLSPDQLREAYQTKTIDRVNHQLLAHVTCCAVCLDEVNRLLNLPMLAEREPEKMTGRDKRDRDKGDGSGDGSGSTRDFMDKPRHRLKEVLEHRPKELRVSVNGFILGSHAINSELNKLSISAKGEEKIGFVEVFSEEEVRLLFCLVDAPPDGPVERKVVAGLSDDRSLELFLDFSDSWPNLNVTYHDPTFTAEAGLLSLQSQVELSDSATSSVVKNTNSKVQSPLNGNTGLLARLRRRLSDFGLWTLDFGLFLKPGAVTAIFALVLIASLVLMYWRAPAPIVTAEDLLRRSIVAEETIAASGTQVLHRTLQLEERRLPSRELVARSRIEVWEGKGVSARRLYDGQNKLVAGEWAKSDGSRVLYHHGSKLTFRSAQDLPREHSLTSDEIWKATPSAKEFTSLVAQHGAARVDETPASYLLEFDATSATSATHAPRVLRASLVLGRHDLHATELILVIEGADSQPFEFRFTETGYERRAPQGVAPAIFEPDPELLSSAKLETRNSKPETNALSLLPVSPPAAGATAGMEVEVLGLLGQISADMGQEVSVKRETDGALHVEAIVESEKRKAEILSALSPAAHERALRIRIETTAEAQARIRRESHRGQANIGSQVNLDATTTANVIPVDVEVRRYLRSKGTSEKQLNEEVSRLSNRMLNRSHQALLHAFAIKNLVERFSADDLRSLDADARAKWLAMIATHAHGFQGDLASIRQELGPIFGSVSSSSVGDEMGVADDASLFRAVSRLTEIASFTNESVQSAFTISSGNKSVAVRTPQFWHSLSSGEKIAQAIQTRER